MSLGLGEGGPFAGVLPKKGNARSVTGTSRGFLEEGSVMLHSGSSLRHFKAWLFDGGLIERMLV